MNDTFYDDRIQPSSTRRRVQQSIPSTPSGRVSRVDKLVDIVVQSVNTVEVGDQREPRKAHLEMTFSARKKGNDVIVDTEIPLNSTADFALEDMIEALQQIKQAFR